MTDNDKHYFRQLIDDRLDRLTRQRTEEYIRRYATQPDGQVDPALSYRIEREIHRRSAMSCELDIHEPIRWIALSTVLSVIAGVAIKATTEKSFSRPALMTLMASTAIGAAIQSVRLLPRFDAALKGGVDTALAMHEFDIAHHGKEAVDALVTKRGDDPWVKRVADSNGWELNC